MAEATNIFDSLEPFEPEEEEQSAAEVSSTGVFDILDDPPETGGVENIFDQLEPYEPPAEPEDPTDRDEDSMSLWQRVKTLSLIHI